MTQLIRRLRRTVATHLRGVETDLLLGKLGLLISAGRAREDELIRRILGTPMPSPPVDGIDLRDPIFLNYQMTSTVGQTRWVVYTDEDDNPGGETNYELHVRQTPDQPIQETLVMDLDQ